MKRKADIFVEGLKVPYLYGDKDEYGIKYPTGYKVSGKPRVDIDFAGGGGYSGDPTLVARALEMIQPEAEEIPMGQPTAAPALPDRETYTKELDKRLEAQFGRDPRTVNIFGEALKMYNEKLKPFWSHIFPKVPHGGMLDDDQSKFWMKAKEQLMARCYNSVKGHVETQTGMYKRARTEGMVLYEDKREEAEKGITGAAQISKESRTLERQLEKEKRVETRKLETEERAYERKIETEIRKELREAGKTKELTRTDYAALTSAYLGLMKEIKGKDEERVKLRINSINKIRESLGLKPMKVNIIPGKEPWYWFDTKESKEYLMDFGEGLPSGLTEEDIKYNMEKYNKTREEVIERFKGKK